MTKAAISITSKLPKVGTSIFTKMSALAQEYGALNLSQGFPDFDMDARLIELVHNYMKKGANQYAPMAGALPLRQVLSDKMERLYGVSYDPESEITITAGGTQALYTAISAFIREDDEVIVFTPAYDSYVPAIELHGGKPKYVSLKAPDYRIDWDEVKKLVNHKTRMMIINTPHNPTGTIMTESDMCTLERIVAGNSIIVLSDEVYEHLVFDGKTHESVSKYPTLRKQSLAVFSFGKTLHITGWKMGYIVGPEYLMNEFRKVHQFTVFSCNHPVQLAIAEYLQDTSSYDYLGSFYQNKRDVFLDAIKGSSFVPIRCEGTYFQLLSYGTIAEDKDVVYAEKLIKEKGIAAIPISVFYNTQLDQKILRFCFAKKNETLLQAGEILKGI
jgi:methionine aminotransferase